MRLTLSVHSNLFLIRSIFSLVLQQKLDNLLNCIYTTPDIRVVCRGYTLSHHLVGRLKVTVRKQAEAITRMIMLMMVMKAVH